MLENYCKFFKSNGGWCVIIPCSLEEDEVEEAPEITYQDKEKQRRNIRIIK